MRTKQKPKQKKTICCLTNMHGTSSEKMPTSIMNTPLQKVQNKTAGLFLHKTWTELFLLVHN